MTKTQKKQSSAKKFTLVELVSNSDLHYPLIIMNLSRAGLLEHFEKEQEASGILDIEPSMTEAEFNKIMEA